MKENKKKENLRNEDINLGGFFDLASYDKIYLASLNLHEFKNEVLVDYKGIFEILRLVDIGPAKHKTSIRFKNTDDFESSINAIDVD